MTMKRLYLKALLFLAIIGAAIFAFDKSGIFAPDQANYHEKRRPAGIVTVNGCCVR